MNFLMVELVTILFKEKNSKWYLIYLMDDDYLIGGGKERNIVTQSIKVVFYNALLYDKMQ